MDYPKVKQMINYLFDIDGTITPSREIINEDFRKFFCEWIVRQQNFGNKVFFVTGSDVEKTIEQIGLSLWESVDGSYQCCGSQLYRKGKLVKESKWSMSANLYLDLMILIEKSPWFGKAKNNIEERVGMVNVTTLGRSATKRQRQVYCKWDKATGERRSIVERLSMLYPKLEFSVGGEISIDIYPRGKNKSQALLDMDGKTIFFGDRCEPSGNDFPISSKSDVCHHVSGWKEAYKILMDKYNDYTGT